MPSQTAHTLTLPILTFSVANRLPCRHSGLPSIPGVGTCGTSSPRREDEDDEDESEEMEEAEEDPGDGEELWLGMADCMPCDGMRA